MVGKLQTRDEYSDDKNSIVYRCTVFRYSRRGYLTAYCGVSQISYAMELSIIISFLGLTNSNTVLLLSMVWTPGMQVIMPQIPGRRRKVDISGSVMHFRLSSLMLESFFIHTTQVLRSKQQRNGSFIDLMRCLNGWGSSAVGSVKSPRLGFSDETCFEIRDCTLTLRSTRRGLWFL